MLKRLYEGVVKDPMEDTLKYAACGIVALLAGDIAWSAAQSIDLSAGITHPGFSMDTLNHTFDRHPLFGLVHDVMSNETVQVVAGSVVAGVAVAPWLAPWLWSSGGGHHEHGKDDHAHGH